MRTISVEDYHDRKEQNPCFICDEPPVTLLMFREHHDTQVFLLCSAHSDDLRVFLGSEGGVIGNPEGGE